MKYKGKEYKTYPEIIHRALSREIAREGFVAGLDIGRRVDAFLANGKGVSDAV